MSNPNWGVIKMNFIQHSINVEAVIANSVDYDLATIEKTNSENEAFKNELKYLDGAKEITQGITVAEALKQLKNYQQALSKITFDKAKAKLEAELHFKAPRLR